VVSPSRSLTGWGFTPSQHFAHRSHRLETGATLWLRPKAALCLLTLTAGLLALGACESGSTASGRASQVAAKEAPSSSTSKPSPPSEMTTEQMYRSYCASCHNLELVESQHLDRATWRWVMDDVVNEYGATWITPAQQEILIDYLVEHHGPQGKSAG